MIARVLRLSLAAICFCPSIARAEPITITSGSAVLVALAGPGPTMTANLNADTLSIPFTWWYAQAGCIYEYCLTGGTVELTTILESLGPVNTSPTENHASSPSGRFAYTGNLIFTGPAFVLPTPLGVPFVVSFTGPFTLTGTLSTYQVVGVFDPLLISTAELVGAGTVTGRYTAPGLANGAYMLNRLEYQFTPIPEPGTLVLTMGGLLSFCSMKRRYSARKQVIGN